MNTATVSTPTRRGVRSRVSVRRAAPRIALRAARPEEAGQINALIAANREEGHLLPRSIGELTVHAHRFAVAVEQRDGDRRERIVGCAELAPLSDKVAEVRSLAVDRSARRAGIGRRLLDDLRRRSVVEGFETLCAFTHDAAYFVRKGFSIVPHTWIPEKIARDCQSCALFRRCGQYAVVLPLATARG